MKKIIAKVRQNKINNQKMVTIPADSEIKKDDYVEIKKIFSLLFVFIICLNFISSSLICELQPHFFQSGTEIEPTSDIEFSDFSFSVNCENTDSSQRLLSLTVSNYSSNFGNSIKKETIPYLRIKEKRVLFETELIPNNFTSANETFYLTISALNEKNWTFVSGEASKTISFNKVIKQEDLIQSVGKIIMPSNPKLGFIIGIGTFIIVIFLIWYSESSNKLSNWRRQRKMKKQQKQQEELRWKQQRG